MDIHELRAECENEGERENLKEDIEKRAQKAKAAFNRAGSVLQNSDAMEEVKEELNKGGKGRVLFFFIIFAVNVFLGTFEKIFDFRK